MGARLNSDAERESTPVPSEPLKAVFTPDVLRALSTATNPTETLLHRLNVLTASGPLPDDEEQAYSLKWLRARRAAWEVYLEASFACGMFAAERGADLRSRLVGIDDDGFRSAIAECMTCWFLAGPMKLHVEGLAQGRGSKMLDMCALLPEGVTGVEVKAPFRERPIGTTTWWGNDADKIRQCIERANKQFHDGCANLLVIAPTLRTRMFADRRVLVQAIYGESVIVFDVNPKRGRLENHRLEFSPRGKFLNTRLAGGQTLKSDGVPAYRRVSAVLCIEERLIETHPFPADDFVAAGMLDDDRSEIFRSARRKRALHDSDANELWIGHDVLLLHNPNAHNRLSEEPWNSFPQLVPRGDRMEWTDGYNQPV